MNNAEQDSRKDMTYQEALDFLYSQLPMFSRVGAAAYKPGLDTSVALDNYFGNPHRRFKAIHVGGTNGKGSSSHLLAATLQAQGYKTGLYTSPHLVDFRERMRINGEMIPEESVVDFVEKWKASESGLSPSFFELTMMMAFDWFAKEEVDYAVIEVGMGGRLDSTNIITPEICVITNISNDHTQFLGDTLVKIAGEKAGIIKAGIPVVIGEAEGEIREVFEKKASEVDSPIDFASDSLLYREIKHDCEGWRVKTDTGDFLVPLAGEYQKRNINTALHAVKMARNVGITISDEAIAEGFSRVDTLTGLRGRWTKVSSEPLTIADTGHNIAGISYNMNQLAEIMSDRDGATLRIVIGFVADKAIDKILQLLPRDAEYYITNAHIPRALPASDLKEKMDAAGLRGKKYDNVEEAYRSALAEADKEDVIFVGGSTFIVADLFAYIDNQ